LLCHTSLLKEQPGALTPSPLAEATVEPLCMTIQTTARDGRTMRW
jgi:hypothetical protein